MNERMAPGHAYMLKLGTGIQWLPDAVKLWEGGKVTAEALHATNSPYEFWHSLAFSDCFPEVTHWWFRSAWTQKVRLSPLQGLLQDGAAWGLMQYIDENTPAGIYTITETEPPVIVVPYPPNEVHPANLPLRLAISRLVAGVITADASPGQWHLITSLVKRDQLVCVFPTEQHILSWQMESIDTPLRDALCQLQGLHN
jgi:hypothetical protein